MSYNLSCIDDSLESIENRTVQSISIAGLIVADSACLLVVALVFHKDVNAVITSKYVGPACGYMCICICCCTCA